MNIIEGAGIFIYPLGLCSFVAIYMILDRLIALRTPCIIPNSLKERLTVGKLDQLDFNSQSVAGRIMLFFKENEPDSDALKAYARYEVARLSRGLFLLDVIIAGAPLLGLLGTVVGLTQVFSRISIDTGMPDPSAFVQGIALALTTTVLGLIIAIPALVGNSYIGRRIEIFAAQIEVLLERLLDIKSK
ncbi:MAG: MotA/TolQ/ExbB proton channel family protein [Verrucomicrobia bacterium]|nr:MAG: MotA/TolQ/ExbB proton channel family protein [Verrucomicrobiota bacterium]